MGNVTTDLEHTFNGRKIAPWAQVGPTDLNLYLALLSRPDGVILGLLQTVFLFPYPTQKPRASI